MRCCCAGDAGSHPKLNASQCRSDDFESAVLQSARSDARGLAWTHYVRRDWGLQFSARQARDSSGRGSQERDLGLGLISRG